MDTSFFSKFKISKNTKTHRKHHANPHTHWIYLLRLFFILAVLLIIFSFYLLYKIKNEELFQATAKTGDQPSLIKENLLKSVTESFDAKAQKEGELKTGTSVYSDPSL